MERKDTKVVKIGDRIIGGKNPILIQSMTNTKTEDVKATVEQINRLAAAGCDITGWLLLPWSMEQIKSESIRATSEAKSVCRLW